MAQAAEREIVDGQGNFIRQLERHVNSLRDLADWKKPFQRRLS
jgi:hypothetical protein